MDVRLFSVAIKLDLQELVFIRGMILDSRLLLNGLLNGLLHRLLHWESHIHRLLLLDRLLYWLLIHHSHNVHGRCWLVNWVLLLLLSRRVVEKIHDISHYVILFLNRLRSLFLYRLGRSSISENSIKIKKILLLLNLLLCHFSCFLLLFSSSCCFLVNKKLPFSFFLIKHGSIAHINSQTLISLERNRLV